MSDQAQGNMENFSSSSKITLKKIFTFENFYTPKAITIVYWLLCLVSVMSGISIMSMGYGGISGGTFFAGLIAVVGGLISSRIICEIVIVLFKINENLKAIAIRKD